MDQQKIIAGVCSFVLLLSANVANKANADGFNSLKEEVVEQEYNPASNKEILQKYKNYHSLNDKDLKELLEAIGFEGKSLKMAWATAKAESNGRPFAFNGNSETGDSSYGVFQINMIGKLGPDRREKFDLDSNVELFNPVTNSQITFHMTKGGKDWSAWSSVNGPRYQEWYSKYPCKS